MNRKSLVVQAGVFVLFIIIALFFAQHIDTASELRSAVTSLGPLGWMGFVLLYTAGSVLLFPGTVFTVVGALLYGLWFGFFLSLIGATFGAIGAYVVARILGKQAFDGLAPKRLRDVEASVTKRPFETVLFLRLIPIIPFNALNAALGVTRIRLKPYVLGTIIGIAPGTFAYTYATVRAGEVVSEKGLHSLSSSDLIPLIPVAAVIGALVVLPLLVRRFQRNKFNKDKVLRS